MAFFGDREYTVKIDKLRTGEIRYLCWNNNSSLLGRPNLVLVNGKVRQSPEKDAVEYVFSHENSTFTVEHISAIQKGGMEYFFLEVCDQEQKKSTWKMDPKDIPKYFIL
ncbi:hypothetical protein [Flagellimonas crocea]|uniref:hypothetical protein n=1 Tax=Flagellimonas crocea TaxID=3067311 RepID=UPI00296EE36A|nr:hypothetical protein [Muricauda sp. DH64]